MTALLQPRQAAADGCPMPPQPDLPCGLRGRPSSTVVEITTLGRFRVRYDDRDVIGLRRQPVRASLLVYLAMEREATRDTLVGMFWPDFTEGRARNALSQTLHRLRRDLGDWMRAEGEAVVVADGVALDACAFERAV
jgi:DNA-binding SARP family transcriptional activator